MVIQVNAFCASLFYRLTTVLAIAIALLAIYLASLPHVVQTERIALVTNSESDVGSAYEMLVKRLNKDSVSVSRKVTFTVQQFVFEEVAGPHAAVSAALAISPTILIFTDILGLQEATARGVKQPLLFESNVNPARNLVMRNSMAGKPNIAGIIYLSNVHELRLGLLKATFPHIRNLGVIGDHYYTELVEGHADAIQAAKGLGLGYRLFLADDEKALNAIWQDPAAKNVDAWYVAPGKILREKMQFIAAQINKSAKPSMYWRNEDVLSGGLMAVQEVTPDIDESMYRLILMVSAGVQPSEIPLIMPLSANAYLNVATMKEIGGKLPSELVGRFSAFYK